MMNRPGAVPQSLRGVPGGGFGGQQQQQQQQQQSGRALANRLPNGKIGPIGNGPGWFGGMPMGGSASVPPGAARQIGGNVSFAQSLTGSQPATPLDLSEFPSLSNTSQLTSTAQTSMWSAQGPRNLGGGIHRGAGTPLSSQQTQQDDLFASRLSTGQGSFRFGNQGNTAQASQSLSSVTDEFPPLNRAANGEIGGQDRGGNLMSNLGFGAPGSAAGSAMHASRAGNGLLSALSATSRTADVRSPTAIGRPQDLRSPVGEDEPRQKPAGYREEPADGVGGRNPLGAIGNDAPTGKGKDEEKPPTNQVQDPLEGMALIDKWGLKGLRTLMNNFPDYNALTCGIDPSLLGVDMRSTDTLSTKVYSLFDDVPPRSPVPKFRLPDCYHVKNVQPIEAKISSFNEETLMWIFYSCPRDIKQQMAAIELNNRNWRWHKKYQFWLTKDDIMAPQNLGPGHERGYYIVWDTVNWRKERRELMLQYADLDTTPTAQLQSLGA
ncbi:uncharacterized protein B0T15DRAFT_529035 [Chaetomium strumarium]|uniref:NOT2/NOT3/NOT5 C-terminal domain-containing protein n=1 Tax=Chaetomium strumarium TaxID=1170767 RepID=A0AAJ0GVV8_9PEZI|nr:hypothetical protein B0T15DRAFT_529035 [Chaetomium strumarium]